VADKAEGSDKRTKTNDTTMNPVAENLLANATTVNTTLVVFVDFITDAIPVAACTETRPVSNVHRQSGPLFDVPAIPQKRVPPREFHFAQIRPSLQDYPDLPSQK
jgi:hypothetical protein